MSTKLNLVILLLLTSSFVCIFGSFSPGAFHTRGDDTEVLELPLVVEHGSSSELSPQSQTTTNNSSSTRRLIVEDSSSNTMRFHVRSDSPAFGRLVDIKGTSNTLRPVRVPAGAVPSPMAPPPQNYQPGTVVMPNTGDRNDQGCCASEGAIRCRERAKVCLCEAFDCLRLILRFIL